MNEEEQTILAKIALFRYYLIERSRLVFFYAFSKFEYAEFKRTGGKKYFHHVADFQAIGRLDFLSVYKDFSRFRSLARDGAAF